MFGKVKAGAESKEPWRRRVGNRGEIVAKGQEGKKGCRPVGENEMETLPENE